MFKLSFGFTSSSTGSCDIVPSVAMNSKVMMVMINDVTVTFNSNETRVARVVLSCHTILLNLSFTLPECQSNQPSGLQVELSAQIHFHLANPNSPLVPGIHIFSLYSEMGHAIWILVSDAGNVLTWASDS